MLTIRVRKYTRVQVKHGFDLIIPPWMMVWAYWLRWTSSCTSSQENSWCLEIQCQSRGNLGKESGLALDWVVHWSAQIPRLGHHEQHTLRASAFECLLVSYSTTEWRVPMFLLHLIVDIGEGTPILYYFHIQNCICTGSKYLIFVIYWFLNFEMQSVEWTNLHGADHHLITDADRAFCGAPHRQFFMRCGMVVLQMSFTI